MRSDFIEITALIRRDHERAIAIWDGSCDDDGCELWIWLPKSMIEYEMRARGVTIRVPSWLARARGLAADVDALRAEVGQLTSRIHQLEARLARVEGRTTH